MTENLPENGSHDCWWRPSALISISSLRQQWEWRNWSRHIIRR